MATLARLRFQDGAVLDLPVDPAQSVAEAALAADFPLRVDCLSGNCGSCVARCVEGQVSRIGDGISIVDLDEIAAGIYPTCMTRLASDAVFELDYPLAPQPSPAARHMGELVEIERVAATVSRLVIRLDDGEGCQFQPGQYVRLRPPGLRVARCYSIASAPEVLPHIELLIRHVPGGQVSGWLESDAAVAGARMTVQGPLGGFALDDRADAAVFVVGGTGLAPALSMIRANLGRMPMLLCFGCTRREDMFLDTMLKGLAVSVPGFEVRIALMEGADGAIREGTAVSLLSDGAIEGAAYHMCGPPAMVSAARAALRSQGVKGERIRAERFAVGA